MLCAPSSMSKIPMYGFHSLVDGPLSCFQFGAFMNKVAINFMNKTVLKYIFIYLRVIPMRVIAR